MNFANNLFNLASKSSGFQENYLLCNGVPCISRLNLQWFHILITLSAILGMRPVGHRPLAVKGPPTWQLVFNAVYSLPAHYDCFPTINAICQGWPAIQKPRATFLKLCYHKEPQHKHGRTWTSPRAVSAPPNSQWGLSQGAKTLSQGARISVRGHIASQTNKLKYQTLEIREVFINPHLLCPVI